MKNKLILILALGLIYSCSTTTDHENNGLLGAEEIKESAKNLKFMGGATKASANLSFIDVTEKYGLTGVEGVTQYAVDFNHDGFVDLVILPDYYSVPRFYKFSPKLDKFILLTDSPLPRELRASYLAFADLNRDGIYDVIAGAPKQKSSLDQDPLRFFSGKVRGGKTIYKEVRGKYPGKMMTTYGISLLDLDLDGELDLYLGNWFDHVKSRVVATPDRLYRGNGLAFKDFSSLLQDEHTYLDKPRIFPNARPTYGVSSCDIDQNGFPDILTASSSGYGNKMWMNIDDPESGRTFVDYGKISGLAHDPEGSFNRQGGGNTFFAGCIDYNNDGIMDVVLGELTHSYDPESRDRSSILSGKQFEFPPMFIRSEYYMDDGTPTWSQGDKRALFLDYNLDGNIDIGVDNSGFPPTSRFVLFEQRPNHSFYNVAVDFSLDILNPSGSTVLDFNRDGKPDLLLGQNSIRTGGMKKKIYLYQNITKTSNRSVRIFLRGKKANHFGVGATVIFATNKKVQKRYIDYLQGGFSSQHEEGPIFGLPRDEKLEYIEVKWPSLDKNRVPVVVRYQTSKLHLNKKTDLTLCESGRLYKKKNHCP